MKDRVHTTESTKMNGMKIKIREAFNETFVQTLRRCVGNVWLSVDYRLDCMRSNYRQYFEFN